MNDELPDRLLSAEFERLKKGVARVILPDHGKQICSAFLVGPFNVATCYHAIESLEIAEPVDLEFEGDPTERVKGKIEKKWPSLELGLITLDQQARWEPFALLPVVDKALFKAFYSYGYPLRDQCTGAPFFGQILSLQNFKFTQGQFLSLFLLKTGLVSEEMNVEVGHSGSPLFIEQDGKGVVCGVITNKGRRDQKQVALAAPVAELVSFLSGDPIQVAEGSRIDFVDLTKKGGIASILDKAEDSDKKIYSALNEKVSTIASNYQLKKLDIIVLLKEVVKIFDLGKEARKSLSDEYLTSVAKNVAVVGVDLTSFSKEDFQYFQLHQVDIPYAVFYGSALREAEWLAEDYSDLRDSYSWENAKRCVSAMANILNADRQQFNQGYSANAGSVNHPALIADVRIFVVTLASWAKSSSSIEIHGFEDIDCELQSPHSRFVARKQSLSCPIVRRQREGYQIYGIDQKHFYIWDGTLATPIQDISVDGLSTAKTLTELPDEDGLMIGLTDSAIHIAKDGEIRKHKVSGSGSIFFSSSANDQKTFVIRMSGNRLESFSLENDDQVIAKTAEQVRSSLDLGDATTRIYSSPYLFSASMLDIWGVSTLVVRVDVNTTRRSVIAFLDPENLESVRPPIPVGDHSGKRTSFYFNNTQYIAYGNYCLQGGNYDIEIWDIPRTDSEPAQFNRGIRLPRNSNNYVDVTTICSTVDRGDTIIAFSVDVYNADDSPASFQELWCYSFLSDKLSFLAKYTDSRVEDLAIVPPEL